MASAVTHTFLAFALGKTFLPPKIPLRFWIFSIFCSILPDVDALGFYLGLPYGNVWGHRGFFHSFLFAFLLSFSITHFGFREWVRFPGRGWLFLYFFFLTSAHGLVDAMTDGGLGVAFFSPFDSARYFFPWTPLRVSPIGVEAFFSYWGREVLLSEIKWVWIPSLLLWAGIRAGKKILFRTG